MILKSFYFVLKSSKVETFHKTFQYFFLFACVHRLFSIYLLAMFKNFEILHCFQLLGTVVDLRRLFLNKLHAI